MIGGRWLTPSWRARALDWVDERLGELGWARTGRPEQPHVRPWATALRIPTDHGPVWLKASAAGTAHEHATLPVLAEVAPGLVLAPLAGDPVLAWSLLPDGGLILRDRLVDHPGERFPRWAEVLRQHAALQRLTAPAVDRLLAGGAPDLRPGAIEAVVDAIIADPDIDLALRRLAERTWRPRILEAAAELAASGVPSTLQHDDLHEANVLLDGAAYRVFDWGDASVSHPFGVFLVLRRQLADAAGVDEHGPELTRLQDVYLECFTDLAPRADLEGDLRRAEYVAGVGRISSWGRALQGATAEEIVRYGDAKAGWLSECVEQPPP